MTRKVGKKGKAKRDKTDRQFGFLGEGADEHDVDWVLQGLRFAGHLGQRWDE